MFVRILGINIAENMQVYIGLTKVYGIGKRKAIQICKYLNIIPTKKIGKCNTYQINNINKHLNKQLIEGDLRRKISMDIKRKIELKCYEGIYHKRNLPVRGQRTKTNAKTRKKNKKKY